MLEIFADIFNAEFISTYIRPVLQVLRPVLDIGILSVLIYHLYKILVQTKAMQLLRGASFIVLIYVVAVLFNLETMLWLMNAMATVLVIIIAIVFQPELRNIFIRIGQGDWFKLMKVGGKQQLDAVFSAIELLSSMRRGALIVFARNVGLKHIVETGTRLNAELSSALIMTLFSFDTPLHDGAIVIQDDKILAAGCFLPLSEQSNIRKSFGTRHRAALGLAEESDAVMLVVSEETGAISLAFDANLYYDLDKEEIERILNEQLSASQYKEGTSDED